MTTNDNIILRPIADWPYSIASNIEVWSHQRIVGAKNGSKRTIMARRITPVGRRVTLSDAPRKETFNVDRLYRRYFPEIAYPKVQACCRNGHPLIEPAHEVQSDWLPPRVAYWGCGNRICRHCNPDLPEKFANGYSRASGSPERPRGDNDEIAGMVSLGHGFQIETIGDADMPRPDLVPDRLRELDALLREMPQGTAWGADDYAPGCHGFAARP
ncbi:MULTISPECIES: hypothetical protein [Mycobacterium]|uniref:hypothetical protein n=1 Tax=Mycobacterium TaxID=1763 RepID=UPI0010580A8C|nr:MULTISPECIES: hypothetical protein [Mycobacterium]MDM4141381.1 hypothetical protein [Mycobacterium sp. FLAC0960]